MRLRAALPDRVLALAAPAWLTPLVELIGGVDRLVPTAGLAPVGWRVPPPYRAVNLHGRGPESHRLLLASAPKRLWAFRCPDAGHLDGPQWMDDRARGRPVVPVAAVVRGAERPVGSRASTTRTVEVPAGVTVLHPGGKSPERRWPAERFGVLARELVALGHRPVVTGTPAERPLAERVAAVGGLPPEAVLAGRTGLAELAALVARAPPRGHRGHRGRPSGHRFRYAVSGALRAHLASAMGAAERPRVAPRAVAGGDERGGDQFGRGASRPRRDRRRGRPRRGRRGGADGAEAA